MNRPFLTSKWLDLIMLNWKVEPSLLEPYVPSGTVLDTFEGKHYLSIVGLRFEDTRLLGVPIPFHRNFEELNLRFYVLREVEGERRRGVVFIKEIVPRICITAVARLAYNENYETRRMKHSLHSKQDHTMLRYEWKQAQDWGNLWANVQGAPLPLPKGSREEFIAEHYWGYCTQRNGGAVEYRVSHPSWRIWQTECVGFEVDAQELYGPEFAPILAQPPTFSLVAEGSATSVFKPTRLK